MGAAAPGTASFMNATVLKNMLGVAVHLVTGYRGSGELRIAIERGELDGDCGTWSSLPSNWTSNRRINPVVRFSSMPVPGVAADVPFVGGLTDSQDDRALLDVLLAPDALGRPYVASKQVPADRLAALRAAFDATMQDGHFIAEAEKMELPVTGLDLPQKRLSSRLTVRRQHWSPAPARSLRGRLIHCEPEGRTSNGRS
jgi:hypothetical protein